MLSGNRLIGRLLLLSTLAFGGTACAGVTEYVITPSTPTPSTTFVSGTTGRIKVPVSALTDTKIASADGLVFRFADGANFSLQTETDTGVGHPGVDMRTWPEYVLGLKSSGPEPQAYIDDLKKSHQQIIQPSIQPSEIRRFNTSKGTGYWAVGDQKSVIVLTHKAIKDQISVIYTDGLSEARIVNIILNGVSQ